MPKTMKTRATSQPLPAAQAGAASKAAKRSPAPKKAKTAQNGQDGTSISTSPSRVPQEDQNVSITASSPEQDHIAFRAYCIWQEHGCPEGAHEDHWHQAERELTGRVPL